MKEQKFAGYGKCTWKLLLASTLLGASLPVWAAVISYSPPTAGLVGWWRGDGNANDSYGGNNGTLLGGMGFTSGVYNQAFAGNSGESVYIPDVPAFQLTSGLTMSAFVNPSASGYAIFFRGDSRQGLDPYQIGLDYPSTRFALTLQDGSGGVAQLIAPTPLPLNTWSQVAATWDGASGNMSLYVNGSLVASATTSIVPLGALDPTKSPGLAIGNTTPPYDFPFLGGIDEVLLYSRALSPSEIAQLVPEPGTVALLGCGLLCVLLCRKRRAS